jgi:uncharacterized protein (TIGR02597 family)
MNQKFCRRKALAYSLAGVLLLNSTPLRAATELVSGIFGYCSLSLLGNSDTIVSVPFARLPTEEVTVASAASNVVTVQDAVNWTAGQFVYSTGVQSNTYYLRINSGALEGRYYDITNNTTNTLVLDLKGNPLTGLAAGDLVSVVPHWTVGTVFVNGNGVHLTTDPDSHKTDVLIPDVGGAGINLSAAATYYYFTNAGFTAWRRVGSSSTNRNDDVLRPNTYLIIRHRIPTNTTFTSYGDVILTKVSIPLIGNPTNKQDNPVAMPRPVTLTLNDTALIASGAFSATTDPDSRTDELLVFNNATNSFNKSSAGTYYFYNSTWRRVGDSASHGTSNVFAPGAGFIIRKASGGSSVAWTNTPTYTNN